MKQSILYSAVILATMATTIFSCTKTATVDNATCSALDTKWSTAVSNIVKNKCATSGCHPNYAALANISGDASSCLSKLSNNSMPAGGVTMTTAERNQLMCWLQDGGPNN